MSPRRIREDPEQIPSRETPHAPVFNIQFFLKKSAEYGPGYIEEVEMYTMSYCLSQYLLHFA